MRSAGNLITRTGLALATVGVCLLPALANATPTPAGGLVEPMFSPLDCNLCHGYQNPAADQGVPPYAPIRTWQGTMMANAARDPVFWAGIAVAADDIPGATDACIRCHSPRAWLEGNEQATAMVELTSLQQNGVECMLCHRSMEDPDMVVPPGNAMYTIDETVVGTNVPRRGPWSFGPGSADPEVPPPPHSYIQDPYIGTSRLCGTCHDVTTPATRLDDAGVSMGTSFNEQRTYSEWANSAYAVAGDDFQSCQDCHMPAVDNKPGCQAHVNQYTHDTGGRRHDLAGANRFMVEMIKAQYGDMGQGLIADSLFDNTLAAIDAFLPTSASLEVSGPDMVDATVGIDAIDVRVINNTGHKLPSGYSEGRVMWVEVVGRYGDEVVFSSGLWNQDTGIQDDAQLRRYEALAEEYATGTELHLLLNDHWLVDSRIPPLGLQQDIETDPVGDRYVPLGDGTWPNYDDVSYAFEGVTGIIDTTPDDATDDELELTITLRYLINTPEYMDFLADNAGEAGMSVATMFDLAGGATPVTLAQETLTVPLTGLEIAAGSSTSGTTQGDDTSTSDGSTTATPTTSTSTATSTSTSTTTTTTTATTSAEVGTSDDGTDDAGETGDDGGCGCQGGGSPTGVLWLVPFGLFLRRRRRTA